MRFVERQGLRLAYDVVGDGFPLLLHTGAAGDSRMWREAGYVDGLSEFHVVLLDHRGHGQSDAPADRSSYTVADCAGDVAAIVDELGIERFAFWGYSDGAYVGYAMAAAHPERIAALVASGGVDPPDEEPEELRRAARAVRERGIRAILGSEAAPEWLIRQLADETDREVVARELECFAGWSPWPHFPRIEAPTLIVAGELEAEHCAAAATAIPDGRAVVLPGLGHLGAFVHSELVLAVVVPFLRANSARWRTRLSGYHRPSAMRTVWVSFDTVGRDCLEAAADVGADVVGVVTLSGPIDPNRSGQCSFDAVAKRHGARLVTTTDVNADATLEAIRVLEPELIFVVGWSQLVRDPFIALAKEGVFGMHPTLLPRHRGRAPIPWAILSGLARTGVTLFEIVDATADSGAIVGQTIIDISPEDTATTLFDRIAEAHVMLIREVVPQLIATSAPRVPQDSRRASSWPRRTPADGIIDWETRALYLHDWVRAQTRPYPGAFTFLGDEKVVIWRARPVALDAAAPPGTIVAERPEGPVVACGEGGLLLEEVDTGAGALVVGARFG